VHKLALMQKTETPWRVRLHGGSKRAGRPVLRRDMRTGIAAVRPCTCREGEP